MNFDIRELIVILFLGLLWYLLIGRFWLRALLSGVRITPTQIILMRLRNNPVNLIVNELIKAAKGGVIVSRDELEACHMAGGNVSNVVDGLIYANAHNIELDIKTAMKLDLQRHNIINHLINK
ncbi:flotillin-like FloA family protein [Sunxiuqinia sp. A32]|uniref:flotillin-like FloA family protein n=1 Tax=Sunxiuqinia sp. A32 TaxID=3461496 RepID=UPI00404679F5